MTKVVETRPAQRRYMWCAFVCVVVTLCVVLWPCVCCCEFVCVVVTLCVVLWHCVCCCEFVCVVVTLCVVLWPCVCCCELLCMLVAVYHHNVILKESCSCLLMMLPWKLVVVLSNDNTSAKNSFMFIAFCIFLVHLC